MLKKIKVFILLFLLFLMFLAFSILFSGIKISSFQLLNFKISEFYIKLDKKLILSIENIEYTSKKNVADNSIEDLKNSFEVLPNLLKWFESIDIKNLKINDNRFKILLNDDNLNIESKLFALNSKIAILSKQVELDVSSLYLKDLDILIQGKVKLDYFDENLKYFGNIFYKDLKIEANIDIEKNRLNFFLRSYSFASLNFLKEHLDLPQIANEWMYDNVKGDFNLDWFYGQYDLDKSELIEKSLQGEAFIKDAKIRFENSLDEIIASRVNVNFKNSTLHFDLIDAKYKGKELKNSFVNISNIADEKKGLVLVNIEAITALDKDVLGILKAYDIDIPVLQKNGATQAKLLLKFPYDEDSSMDYEGEFIVEKSDISISSFAFKTNSARVILQKNLLFIKDASFLYKDMIDAKVNIKLDLNTLKANGESQIKRVLIKDDNGSDILNLANKNSDISMDFKDDVNIILNDLKTTINYNKFLTIKFDDISKLYEYSNILRQNGIKTGNLFLKIIDENKIDFNGSLGGFSTPLKKENQDINSLDFFGNIDKNSVDISSNDNSIKLSIKDNIYLFLDGYEVFFDEEITKKNKIPTNLNIDLKNCKLLFDNKEFKIKDANINFKKELIAFKASLVDLNLPIKKDNIEIKELDIVGKYKNNILDINSKKDDIFLRVINKKLSIKIDGYVIFYDTKDNKNYEDISDIDIIGTKSNIVIDNKYKVLADFYELNINKNRKFFYLEFDDSKMSFSNNNKNIDIYISKIDERFINSFFNNDIMHGGKIDFFANGTIENLKGKMLIQDSSFKNITILNNIMFLIESSPAFINPLLAIPAVFGLNKLGIYKIEEGILEFEYSKDKNIIDIKNLNTAGNGMDFEGSGVLDLEKNEIDANIKLIFFKVYSSFFEHIPILNYILLGNEKRVETQIQLTGNLMDPIITTNLFKDSFLAPINIFKRVFTTPSNMIDDFNKFNNKPKD